MSECAVVDINDTVGFLFTIPMRALQTFLENWLNLLNIRGTSGVTQGDAVCQAAGVGSVLAA